MAVMATAEELRNTGHHHQLLVCCFPLDVFTLFPSCCILYPFTLLSAPILSASNNSSSFLLALATLSFRDYFSTLFFVEWPTFWFFTWRRLLKRGHSAIQGFFITLIALIIWRILRSTFPSLLLFPLSEITLPDMFLILRPAFQESWNLNLQDQFIEIG